MTGPTSAAQHVFAVTELAEQIFLELPARQILVDIQRVCRGWKMVVEGSLPLQQALFFQPITDTRVQNPSFMQIRQYMAGWYIAENPEKKLKTYLHPLAAEMHARHSPPPRCKELSFSPPDASVAYPEASWRRQLCSQPFASQVSVRVRSSSHRLMTCDKSGVTMSQLMGKTGERQKEYTRASLKGVYWCDSPNWDTQSAKDFVSSVQEGVEAYWANC